MRFRVRKPGAKLRAKRTRLKNWHNWFAWFPVRVPQRGKELVWLETIERKGTKGPCHCTWDGYYWWEYRNIKEVEYDPEDLGTLTTQDRKKISEMIINSPCMVDLDDKI